jgi:2-polyprenyl-3-methyl-5-hydroxy-6-metoxy-1,4-benzoquinol methylase
MTEITNIEAIDEWSNAPQESLEAFGDEGDFVRQHLLNPAIFEFLGDVAGKRILDAGCGQGYLSRLLVRRGAIVTGVEPAANFYRYAIERERSEQLGISYVQEDLSALSLASNIFDAVIANKVFMDIPDYETAMRNCIAVLKPDGSFIFSLLHPCFEETGAEWVKKGYVEVREYLQEHTVRQSFAYLFHRPLSTYINFVIQEGCALQKMIEPRLDEELAQKGSVSERYVHVPGYVVICAIRGSALTYL